MGIEIVHYQLEAVLDTDEIDPEDLEAGLKAINDILDNREYYELDYYEHIKPFEGCTEDVLAKIGIGLLMQLERHPSEDIEDCLPGCLSLVIWDVYIEEAQKNRDLYALKYFG